MVRMSVSTFLAPPSVFTRRIKNTSVNAVTTLATMPMPNQRMISGASATRGRLLSARTSGASTSSQNGERASMSPAAIPSAEEMKKAISASNTVMPTLRMRSPLKISCQSSLLTRIGLETQNESIKPKLTAPCQTARNVPSTAPRASNTRWRKLSSATVDGIGISACTASLSAMARDRSARRRAGLGRHEIGGDELLVRNRFLDGLGCDQHGADVVDALPGCDRAVVGPVFLQVGFDDLGIGALHEIGGDVHQVAHARRIVDDRAGLDDCRDNAACRVRMIFEEGRVHEH